MKKTNISLAIVFSILCTLFFGCTSNKKSSATVDVSFVPGGSTLFIYMCGSNLESQKGLAGSNIDERLAASVSDNLNIVIQTGGANQWLSHGIDAEKTQRYVIKNGKLGLAMSLDNANMGEADTLTDFLTWGQENYASERNILVMWDHGGGSAKGVCFDENYSFDALTLPEMKQAFCNAKLKKKFDIIGFDACLMASIEVAAVMSDYADYMVASEEIEPSGGWDYKTFSESITNNNDSLAIGKIICDSFMDKCNGKKNDAFSTLSVLDLSKIDPMLEKFTEAAEYLNRISGTQNYFSQVLNAAHQSEKFGINNAFEGSSNMVDFIDFTNLVIIEDLFAYFERDDFVAYSVNAGTRNNSGVSFYYPITTDENEIEEYISLGICEEYNDFLSTYYLNVPKETISFSDKGSISDDGSFSVRLTDESHKHLAMVNYLLIETESDGTPHILSSGADINTDWDSLTFRSDFKDNVPSIASQRFYSKLHVDRESFLDYEIPAIVNGKNTYIRYYYTPMDSSYIIPGTCDGFDEEGLPVNAFHMLKNGDKVQLASEVIIKNAAPVIKYGEEFIVSEDDCDIIERSLDGTIYQYLIMATDIFGNTYFSDTATFEKQDDGFKAIKTEPTVYQYELP